MTNGLVGIFCVLTSTTATAEWDTSSDRYRCNSCGHLCHTSCDHSTTRGTLPLPRSEDMDNRGRVIVVGGITVESVTCAWFALCEQDATHFEPHVVLGFVPTCDHCAEFRLARITPGL